MTFIELIGVLGTVASFVGIAISIAIYKKQNESQKLINDFTEDSLKKLKKYEQISYDLLVNIVLNDLRNLAKNGVRNDYWYFKWRFETWNTLTLHWEETDSLVRIRIEGTNFNFRNNSFDDSVDYPAYICEKWFQHTFT